MNINVLLDFFATLAEAGKEGLEAKVETLYGFAFAWLHAKVDSSETKLDDKGELILKLALRDKLIKDLPLEQYPLD